MAKHGKIPDWYNKDLEFEELFHKDMQECGKCKLMGFYQRKKIEINDLQIRKLGL